MTKNPVAESAARSNDRCAEFVFCAAFRTRTVDPLESFGSSFGLLFGSPSSLCGASRLSSRLSRRLDGPSEPSLSIFGFDGSRNLHGSRCVASHLERSVSCAKRVAGSTPER